MYPTDASPSLSPFCELYGTHHHHHYHNDNGNASAYVERPSQVRMAPAYGLMPALSHDPQSLTAAATMPMGSSSSGSSGYRIASGVVRALPPRLHAGPPRLPYPRLCEVAEHTQTGMGPRQTGGFVQPMNTRSQPYARMLPPERRPPPPPPPAPPAATPVRTCASAAYTLKTPPNKTHTHKRSAHDDDDSSSSNSMQSSAQKLNSARKSASSALSAVHRHAWSASDSATSHRHNSATLLPVAATDAAEAVELTSETGCCVMALIDNGHREVGVALCCLPSFSVLITQFSDTYTFAKSLSLLTARNPVELLVPHTTVHEECTQTLLRHFGEQVTFTSVQRRFFNTEEGVARLQTLRSTDEATSAVEDTDQYLCVAAANALLTYMEQLHGMQWLPHSLRLTYLHLEQYACITRSTARALRLMADPTAAGAAVPFDKGAAADDSSLTLVPLVNALPRASTVMGRRMVRTSLLQPLRHLGAVNDRHDAVAWLLSDPSRFVTLRQTLDRLAPLDVETLLASFLWRTGPLTAARQRQLLACLVRVWQALEVLLLLERQLDLLLPPLPAPVPESTASAAACPPPSSCGGGGGAEAASASDDTSSPRLMREIRRTLAACRFEDLYATTCLYLDPALRETHRAATAAAAAMTTTNNGSSEPRRRREGGGGRPARDALFDHLRAFFTVQATADSALDVARTRFTQQVDVIVQYTQSLRQTFDLRTLKLEPDSEKLYCLSYTASEAQRAPDRLFKYKYAGGQHFALYTEALKRQQQQQEKDDGEEQDREEEASSYPGRAFGARTTRALVGPAFSQSPASGSRETEMETEAETEAQAAVASRRRRAEWAAATSVATLEADDGRPAEGLAAHAALRRRAQREQASQTRRRRIRCTTDELEALCRAAQQYSEAILTEEVASVQSLLDTLRRVLGRLQAMSEAVALLDLLLTFSSYASLRACVRPTWTGVETEADSPKAVQRDDTVPPASRSEPGIVLCQARHPSAQPPASLTSKGGTAGADGSRRGKGRRTEPAAFFPARSSAAATRLTPFLGTGARMPFASSSSLASSLAWMGVPNDIVWPAGTRTLIVTGPNAGGKSTLLEQVGQFFVLAQAGCFVPAASARLFLTDTIAAHMLCDALPSVETSSFRRELMELATITSSVTSESLVLIDELGRSTRVSQGFTLAWSTLLFLRQRQVHSLSATHFMGLTRLADGFPDVANVHFTEHATSVAVGTMPSSAAPTEGEAVPHARGPRRTFLHCSHVLRPGPHLPSQYGLQLAAQLGFHPAALELAQRLRAAEQTAAPATAAADTAMETLSLNDTDAGCGGEAIVDDEQGAVACIVANNTSVTCAAATPARDCRASLPAPSPSPDRTQDDECPTEVVTNNGAAAPCDETEACCTTPIPATL